VSSFSFFLPFFLSFFLHNVCFRFSITQQQLINKTSHFSTLTFFLFLFLGHSGYYYLHVFDRFVNLLYRNRAVIPGKIIIIGEKKHAVTLLSLAHRDARAVPETSLHFGFFIVVVTARAQRRAESIFVLG
jgi:ABC-type tungstate transport system substrate-binding protein